MERDFQWRGIKTCVEENLYCVNTYNKRETKNIGVIRKASE